MNSGLVLANGRGHDRTGRLVIQLRFGWGTTASVVQWSECLATDPEARVRFPALP
jgi:hypothetical protein